MTEEVREEFSELRREIRAGFDRVIDKIVAVENARSIDRWTDKICDKLDEMRDAIPEREAEEEPGGALSKVIDEIVRDYHPGGVTRTTLLCKCVERGYRYADATATLRDLLESGWLKTTEQGSNPLRDLIAFGDDITERLTRKPDAEIASVYSATAGDAAAALYDTLPEAVAAAEAAREETGDAHFVEHVAAGVYRVVTEAAHGPFAVRVEDLPDLAGIKPTVREVCCNTGTRLIAEWFQPFERKPAGSGGPRESAPLSAISR